MSEMYEQRLEAFGLAATESRVYVALLGNPALSAQNLAQIVGLPRSSVYPALKSLETKGLIEGGAGYGSRFRAVPPENALPTLIDRERESLEIRERLGKELAQDLSALTEGVDEEPEELLEVLRNRRVIADRFARLQLEAQHEINGLVKAPILTAQRSNPAEEKALARGVKVRVIYEAAILEDHAVRPYLGGWISSGEDARVFDGQLPMKLQLFDAETALLPLQGPNADRVSMLVLIRDRALGSGLRMLFESLWEQSRPLDEDR
jgi:sugar-specific transcriptional regulator TrmB